jgi:mRNA interferase MazF
MTPYRRGDVVLVPFPFTNFKSHKVRPAVIVSPKVSKRGDVIVAFISSVIPFDKHEASAVVLESSDPTFLKTGLKMSSIFRMDKIITLHFSLILRHIGHVPTPLQKKLDRTLSQALGLTR